MADSLLHLAPHLVGRARRGIVGDSRYARTLREAVRKASQDPLGGPLLISGEPGLEKDNIAALIHFGSPARRQLMVRLDGALLRGDGVELFGAAGRGGEASFLENPEVGALLIDKLDRVDPQLLPALLELASSGRWQAPDPAEAPHHFTGRVFFTTEAVVPGFERVCTLIRVPPLRVRRQDLGDWLRYDLRLKSRALGWPVAPVVGTELIRRLQSRVSRKHHGQPPNPIQAAHKRALFTS